MLSSSPGRRGAQAGTASQALQVHVLQGMWGKKKEKKGGENIQTLHILQTIQSQNTQGFLWSFGMETAY